MSCPYKHYNENMKCFWCSIAYQECPEGSLEGFQYQLCSTYQEKEATEK